MRACVIIIFQNVSLGNKKLGSCHQLLPSLPPSFSHLVPLVQFQKYALESTEPLPPSLPPSLPHLVHLVQFQNTLWNTLSNQNLGRRGVGGLEGKEGGREGGRERGQEWVSKGFGMAEIYRSEENAHTDL